MWRLFINKLQTKYELKKRNVLNGSHDVVCPLCFNEEEDIMHLVFNCDVRRKVWWLVYSWLRCDDTIGSINPVEHYNSFMDGLGSE